MSESRQQITPHLPDVQPRPSDREIYRKPVSILHRERPLKVMDSTQGGCAHE